MAQKLIGEGNDEEGIAIAKRGKAQLHTWLAWKKEPGKPFGQAMDANYFDIKMPVVQEFLDWFSGTFELSL